MIKLTAPAKLTLSLSITGIRANGLHELEAEMVTIDFSDTLIIEEGQTEVLYLGDYPIQPTPDEDLIRQALRLVDEKRKVTVEKRIPPGGGLGGGSANAAAILRWAGFVNESDAVHLGSDIPFNIRGGRALVKGIGEEIQRLNYEEKIFTLIIPPFGCSTAQVYKTWDMMGHPKGSNGNDLEEAALKVEPRLKGWKSALEEHTGQIPRLAGSGSTWFVEGSYPGKGFIVARTTQENEILNQRN